MASSPSIPKQHYQLPASHPVEPAVQRLGTASGGAAPNDTIVVGSANFPESADARRDLRAGAGGQGRHGREASSTSAAARPTSRRCRTGRSTSSPSTAACCCSTSTRPRTEIAPTTCTPRCRRRCRRPDGARQVDGRGQGRLVVTQDTATRVNLKSIADLAPRRRPARPRRAAGVPDPARRRPRAPGDVRTAPSRSSSRSTPAAR